MSLLPRLTIAPGKNHLATLDGAPFFYLGDTAWELLHRLTLAEAREYLEARAAQGFNVIQCVALAELNGLRQPTPDGHWPFADEDPARPCEPYWQHVDEVVALANKLGLYVGLLPTWGDKWNLGPGQGPQIFHPANARAYGRWLGSRYREAGIIWILGGDRPVETAAHREVLDALAEGLHEGDGGRGLKTFHPVGGRISRTELPGCSWLDFDMFQSGHCVLALENWWFAQQCRQGEPKRPFLDGEPCYEDHEIMLPEWRPVKPDWRFGAHAVRRAAYWSVLEGACGHVYGAQPCWMMWDERYPTLAGVRRTWRDALQLPGAAQMRAVAGLAQRGRLAFAPQSARVTGSLSTWEARPAAAQAEDFFVIYSPERQDLTLHLAGLPSRAWHLAWEDPTAPGLHHTDLQGTHLPEALRLPASCAGPAEKDVLFYLQYER